jgi:hypothetical protein
MSMCDWGYWGSSQLSGASTPFRTGAAARNFVFCAMPRKATYSQCKLISLYRNLFWILEDPAPQLRLVKYSALGDVGARQALAETCATGGVNSMVLKAVSIWWIFPDPSPSWQFGLDSNLRSHSWTLTHSDAGHKDSQDSPKKCLPTCFPKSS